MKARLLAICMIVAGLFLGGCAFMNEEDRDFYGKGWIKPTDLDKPDNRHPFADSMPPDTTATGATTPKRQPDPEWLIPETTDHSR